MPNPENLRPPFTSETGRENQPKSVEARKRNQARRDEVAAVTKAIWDGEVISRKHLETIRKNDMPVSDNPTYGEFTAASVILRTIQKGTVEDLLKLQKLFGEDGSKPDDEGVKIIIDV